MFPPGSPRRLFGVVLVCLTALKAGGAVVPAPQRFIQEVSLHKSNVIAAQLVSIADGKPTVFAGGTWLGRSGEGWSEMGKAWRAARDGEFVFPNSAGEPVLAPAIPWRDVVQLLHAGSDSFVATRSALLRHSGSRIDAVPLPRGATLQQIAASPSGQLVLASSHGLFQLAGAGWEPIRPFDSGGRLWAATNVLGVAFDSFGQLWFASKAGVGCRTAAGWKFYEGRDGLPWNEFTGMAAGPEGIVWFATRLGAIRWEAGSFHYRQGPRWLPHDDVRQVAMTPDGDAWFVTAGGVGRIERRSMTFAEKAAVYEGEIERHIKRTPFGFVAEAGLARPGDKTSATTHDTDNDGLWTAMYGAGECFAVAATGDPAAKLRAKQSFEALRFLQKVTQGGTPAPPLGYVARTVRSAELPDPNAGRIGHDRAEQKGDRLWKVYEPRWPRSADGKWFWKSDTSSDELDGHYFFYPLYFDFCADNDAEKNRVREVVRDLTDHLITHGFNLVDHDGKTTRWGFYGPQSLNLDPDWWGERGLKSLSILSYLAVAQHITGDAKYGSVARELIDLHGYAQNLMFPKVQFGPGSGNQSDDEMAFMCFYNLLRYSKDETLKNMVRASFYAYWRNEASELNPFFNFAYAAYGLAGSVTSVWGSHDVDPGPRWLEDSMATLRGFPLDRMNWPLRNSHRLDVVPLRPEQARDLFSARDKTRGRLADGRVIPVENRYFSQWNTDPWALDSGGAGNELASGSVFLLPYYMGLYHGFIAKP